MDLLSTMRRHYERLGPLRSLWVIALITINSLIVLRLQAWESPIANLTLVVLATLPGLCLIVIYAGIVPLKEPREEPKPSRSNSH